MRQAPPVVIVCTGGRGWRVLQATLPAIALAAVVAWAASWAELQTSLVAACTLAAALVATTAGWRFAPSAPVTLAWSGEAWSADGVVGQVLVMIDLGGWMLLRLKGESGSVRWLPVAAFEASALRPALYAPSAPQNA